MMNNKNRKLRAFTWVPLHERIKFPPRKADNRKPLFYVTQDGQEYYFINNSDDVIKNVQVDFGGFLTADDDVLSKSKTGYSYDDVLPHEAVVVNVADPYDDFTYQWKIVLNYGPNTSTTFLTIPNKDEFVLQWGTGESGKDISIDHQFSFDDN